MKDFLRGKKTYLVSLATVAILFATGDKAAALANLGGILQEIWPGILMAVMRKVTEVTSKV
jgi:hypothetical protein